MNNFVTSNPKLGVSFPCSIGIRCSWFRSVGPRAVSLLRLILLSPPATTSIYSAGRGAGSSVLQLCCFLFPALCNMLCKLCSTVPCTVRLSIGGSGEAKRENHRLSNTVSEKPSEEHGGISLFFNLQNSSVLASIFELHTGIGLSTCEALRQCHCAFQHCTLCTVHCTLYSW